MGYYTDPPTNTPNHTTHEKPLEKAKDSTEVIRNIDGFCCFVDASWTSSEENEEIGSALYNKEAKLVLHGKAAIEPIGSPLGQKPKHYVWPSPKSKD